MTTKPKTKAAIAAMQQAQAVHAANVHAKPSTCIPAALAQFDNLPDSAHVRLPTVAAWRGISPATVWRWVQSGRLPAPT